MSKSLKWWWSWNPFLNDQAPLPWDFIPPVIIKDLVSVQRHVDSKWLILSSSWYQVTTLYCNIIFGIKKTRWIVNDGSLPDKHRTKLQMPTTAILPPPSQKKHPLTASRCSSVLGVQVAGLNFRIRIKKKLGKIISEYKRGGIILNEETVMPLLFHRKSLTFIQLHWGLSLLFSLVLNDYSRSCPKCLHKQLVFILDYLDWYEQFGPRHSWVDDCSLGPYWQMALDWHCCLPPPMQGNLVNHVLWSTCIPIINGHL